MTNFIGIHDTDGNDPLQQMISFIDENEFISAQIMIDLENHVCIGAVLDDGGEKLKTMKLTSHMKLAEGAKKSELLEVVASYLATCSKDFTIQLKPENGDLDIDSIDNNDNFSFFLTMPTTLN